ncbi:MAG: ABC transporter ATP-binding protein [Canidatus Methanoxibalbensis ujae]|nr:ABC transporter ATP-binding protein [Candidatus Methanoxibalbensis ujae]MCW7077864.1 ABC transporter ATP-binding protein [Candidatus Methanoxibalbensis ujae]
MNVIEIKNLTKKFGDKVVLNGINFDVAEGEVFGYLGPNGAGKTTTMRIILGLLNPTSGEALVMGRNLAEDDEARGRIGVVLENDGLYEDQTAYDNLDYYAQLYDVSKRKERIEELLKFVGLYDLRYEKVGAFSKGMKRKLAIARALVHDPEILFLDEPSAGLDPEAQRMVRELIVNLSKESGKTIFLNSHNLDEVQRICDRTAILHRGKIVVCDTVENLREKFSKPVVLITAGDKRNTERAFEILSSLDFVYDCEKEGRTIKLTLREERQSLVKILTEKGIEIEEIRKERRSLEDIYLEIVGENGK